MDDAASVDIVRKIVATACWLIRFAADPPPAERQQQECSNASMADESDVAGLITGEHGAGLTHDTVLGIDGSFPAANTAVRVGEELIGDRFKLEWRQKACRGAAILMHALPHLDRK